MRPVTRPNGKSRGQSRAAPVRRSAATRTPPQRAAAGRRGVPRPNFISRAARALLALFNPRRPAFIAGMLAAVAGAVVFLFAAGYVHRAMAAIDRAGSIVSADAGLTISAIHLSGNKYEAPSAIYAALGFEAGDSIFAADPQRARNRLKKLPWVRDAEISRRFPDTIEIRIAEKTPFALWRSESGLFVVDRSGTPIAGVERTRFRRLPFFFGEMPRGASDLVEAIANHRAVSARTKAMQKVDGRRWNLLLDDGVVVKLPEDGWARELSALERLIVDNGVLERDIGEIDLRSHDNYIFVLRHPAPRKNSRGEPT